MLSWDQEGSLMSPRTSSWSDLDSVLDPLLSSQPSRWDQLNSDEISLTVKTSRILVTGWTSDSRFDLNRLEPVGSGSEEGLWSTGGRGGNMLEPYITCVLMGGARV